MRRIHSTLKPLYSLTAVALIPVALVWGLLTVAGGGIEGAPAQAQSSPAPVDGLRVYVVVLDGLMPHEIREPLTPRLNELKEGGTWYEQARAVFPAETLPNHAAMMTGVPPQQNGIVGNEFWYPGTGSKWRMMNPALLGADTLTTRLETRCEIATATVQSKTYLWGLFRGEPFEKRPTDDDDFEHPVNPDNPQNQRQADYHWNPDTTPDGNPRPGFIPYPDEHVIDQVTMQEGFLPWLRETSTAPQFAFVNLGDVDRSGHADLSGVAAGVSGFRQAALADTDTQVGALVDYLKGSGAWDETVLIFTSDHGMDWSVPEPSAPRAEVESANQSINLTGILLRNGYTNDQRGDPGPANENTKGDFNVVPGGGTAAVYWEEDTLKDSNALRDAAALIAADSAVAGIASRDPIPGMDPKKNPTLAEMGMDHRYNGDWVVLVRKGFAVRDIVNANPIPGNHGHPATQQSVLLVSGGHPAVDDTPESVGGEVVYDPAKKLFSPPAGGPGNLSVAPTVAALFGIGPPTGGYARGPLTAAFEDWALAPHEPCQAGAPLPPSGGTETGPTKPDDPDGGKRPVVEDSPATPPAAPTLSRLRVRPRSFEPKRSGRSSVAQVRRGATVRYLSTQRARTRFIVKRRKNGRYKRVRGSFRDRAGVGRNSFRFTGWVGGRKLRPGAYRMRAVARNSNGRSTPIRTAFRITRP